MKINLQNYEEYLVRYLDGECSPQEVAEVNSFLQEHPELRADLLALEATILSADEEIFFPKKDVLRKGVTLINYEEFFIRNIERELTLQEENDLSVFMNEHPELQREMNAFAATKLVADSSVIFPYKNSLKKRGAGRLVPMYVRISLIAAAVCLMLIMFMRGSLWQTNPTPIVADSHSIQPETNTGSSSNESISKPQKNEIAFNQSEIDSAKAATSNESKKNKSLSHHNTQLYTDASSQHSTNSVSPFNDVSTADNDEVSRIAMATTPINFQRAFKKASYRSPSNSIAEKKPAVKFSSVAVALGSELLRLSGREDYLNSSTAFNSSGSDRRKLPMALSITGKKFNFSHTFFKKRNHTSSQPKTN